MAASRFNEALPVRGTRAVRTVSIKAGVLRQKQVLIKQGPLAAPVKGVL